MSKVKRRWGLFQPQNYELTLRPDAEGAVFTGSVGIMGELEKPRKNITLHAHELTIKRGWAICGNRRVELSEVKANPPEQEINLIFDQILPKGQLVVWLEYSGQITAPMHGLYASRYQDGEKTLLSTQLEATHARELFPCIDEPEAKAAFDLVLIVPKGQVAIANGPLKQTETSGEEQKLTFATTPEMSTYLLAFVIGELEYVRAKSKGGTEVRVYATPGQKQRCRFALRTAVKLLDFFEDYFQIDYPLPKLDLAAIPNFAAGAMENWGLLTFREEALLLDPDHSSAATQQQVATCVAHELAHQWFGNLVTMRWWTDLWLNEGFATWIEHFALDSLFPKWRVWDQFVSQDCALVLRDDALSHTHPVEVEIDDPEEINAVFDSISYQKGAAIIRMLHDYLGAEKFRRGLQAYLKRYAYSNASTSELWAVLGEVAKQPVADFMSAWTTQSGYPYLSIVPQADDSYEFCQEHFLINPQRRPEQPKMLFWPVPVTFVNSPQEFLLSQRCETFAPQTKEPVLKLNRNHAGFWRCNYPPELLTALRAPLAAKKLPPIERYGILSDTFAACQAGFSTTAAWFDMLESCSDEDDAIVWEAIAYGLVELDRTFATTPSFDNLLKTFASGFIGRQYRSLNWRVGPKDDHLQRLLRQTVLGLAVRFEHKPASQAAYKLFNATLKGRPAHPDVRGAIYAAIARRNTKSGYAQLRKLHAEAELAEERNRLIAPLTGYRDRRLFRESLELITTATVQPQEAAYWIAASQRNPWHQDLAWEWLKEHWQWLLERYRDTHIPSQLVKSLGTAYSQPEQAAEVEKFFTKHSYPGIERSVNQALELIEMKALWRERDQTELRTRLRQY